MWGVYLFAAIGTAYCIFVLWCLFPKRKSGWSAYKKQLKEAGFSDEDVKAALTINNKDKHA